MTFERKIKSEIGIDMLEHVESSLFSKIHFKVYYEVWFPIHRNFITNIVRQIDEVQNEIGINFIG